MNCRRALAAGLALFITHAAHAGYAPGCTVALDLGAGVVHEARAVAIQPDGRIVVAGYVNFGADRDFLVARFHPDLTLDTSFNGVGWVTTNFDANDEAFDVVIQTDGKIIAVGHAENNGASRRFLAIARYLPDGTFDSVFSGYWDLQGGSPFEELFGVALQPDGNVVAVGYHSYAGPPDILAVRFLKDDGDLDTTFDGDGFAELGIGDTSFASDVVIARDGNIVVSATGTFAGNDDFVAVRLRPDGSLDPAFAGGWTSTDVANPDDEATSVAIDVDGNVIVAGTSSDDISIVRYRPDGSLDATFDGDGIAIHDIGTDAGHGMALDSSGNIVVVGEGGAALDLALTRFDASGGNNLSVTTDILAGDRAFDLQIRRDGKFVLAGTSQLAANPQLTLALFNSNGTQDCSEITLHPQANSSPIAFSASGCPANWDCVNDQLGNTLVGPAVGHDGLGSFLSSASATARDLYRLTDPVPPPGTVVTAIEVVAQLSWSGVSNVPSARLLYQRQGFDAVAATSASFSVPNTAFQEFRRRWTGLNWTSAELAALEIGLEHVAGNHLRATQIYVVITYGEPLVNSVEPFTAAATGNGTNGQVTLNWLNPSFGLYDETVIRRSITACPTSPNSDDAVVNQADGLGQTGAFVDVVPLGPTYYYAAFVEDADNHASPRKCVAATPFDRTAVQVDWRYSTSEPIAALATPGLRVSTNVVYSTTNDGIVHAMTGGDGGAGGGRWPAGWKPYRLGAAAPNRPPVVSLPSGEWAALFGAQDGHVYAIGATSGRLVWRSPKLGGMLSSSPAAILSAFGGTFDLVFVGTRDAGQANRLYALNADDGTVAWYFDNGGSGNEIGIITSGPSVSYADERVYFTSFAGGTSQTVWCLNFSAGTPGACGTWPGFGVATSFGGDVGASPILANGDVLVSDRSPGEALYRFDPADGSEQMLAWLGGNGAKDYVFPQFGTPNVIASNASEIFSVDTSTPSVNWVCGMASPSAPLQVIATNDVYAGGSDGKLHRLSTLAPGCPGTSECIGDCSTTLVGSPAYDFSKTMIYLGTDDGNIYGVKTPF
jgi:uncharacterized delta-60 repeat protein